MYGTFKTNLTFHILDAVITTFYLFNSVGILCVCVCVYVCVCVCVCVGWGGVGWGGVGWGGVGWGVCVSLCGLCVSVSE